MSVWAQVDALRDDFQAKCDALTSAAVNCHPRPYVVQLPSGLWRVSWHRRSSQRVFEGADVGELVARLTDYAKERAR